MYTLFRYNWMVREEWFKWCEQVPLEELLKRRTGGVGGILHTLFHIVDVEWSWIRVMQGKSDFEEPFEKYQTLEQVRQLSVDFHEEVEAFLQTWTDQQEHRILDLGEYGKFAHGEILRHVIAHEIHHIGQLSIWARELGLPPITANLIRRGLFEQK